MSVRPHACPQCGRPFSREERIARRNPAISAGQVLAWRDPDKRARRVKAIRNAWDDPLRRALMSEHGTKGKLPAHAG